MREWPRGLLAHHWIAVQSQTPLLPIVHLPNAVLLSGPPRAQRLSQRRIGFLDRSQLHLWMQLEHDWLAVGIALLATHRCEMEAESVPDLRGNQHHGERATMSAPFGGPVRAEGAHRWGYRPRLALRLDLVFIHIHLAVPLVWGFAKRLSASGVLQRACHEASSKSPSSPSHSHGLTHMTVALPHFA